MGVYALSKVHPVPYSALERGAKQAIVVSDVTDGHSEMTLARSAAMSSLGSDLGRRAHEDPEASE